MTGTNICNYRVHEKLGEGGMGTVYRGEDLRLGRNVALKFLSPALQTNEWARQRFAYEARAAAVVNHPNVCRVYDFLEADSEVFIVMALLEGRDLKSYVTNGSLRPPQKLELAAQVADGLSAAHRCGVIHLDVKPSNVIVTSNGRPVLIDFGIASSPGAGTVAHQKTTAGTAAYMSPEQVNGDAVDGRSDVWSLGVVLYELLVGQLPFRGKYRQAIAYSILNEEPESSTIAGESPYVSSRVKTILGTALAKDPGERYSSAEEFATELRDLSYFMRKSQLDTVGARTYIAPLASPCGLSQSASRM
jgi:serine/threonine-protein kinase